MAWTQLSESLWLDKKTKQHSSIDPESVIPMKGWRITAITKNELVYTRGKINKPVVFKPRRVLSRLKNGVWRDSQRNKSTFLDANTCCKEQQQKLEESGYVLHIGNDGNLFYEHYETKDKKDVIYSVQHHTDIVNAFLRNVELTHTCDNAPMVRRGVGRRHSWRY